MRGNEAFAYVEGGTADEERDEERERLSPYLAAAEGLEAHTRNR